MFEQAYRYRFAERVGLRDAGDTLLLAVLAVEGHDLRVMRTRSRRFNIAHLHNPPGWQISRNPLLHTEQQRFGEAKEVPAKRRKFIAFVAFAALHCGKSA